MIVINSKQAIRNICLLAVFVATAGLTGCSAMSGLGAAGDTQASPESEFASRQPVALQPYFRALYLEGERTAVLNFSYLGLAAMEAGEHGIAEKAFDEAILRIEAIYADDPNAQKAKSLWSEEKVKDFKGEPYERSMVYYYRGILYARAGDYDNARASFLAAERHDSLSEKEEYQSDFGLMNFLAAWSSYCAGDEVRANDLAARAVGADAKVYGSRSFKTGFVGLIDSGTGPSKVGEGKYNEVLAFQPSPVITSVTDASADGAFLVGGSLALAGDVNFQATTRGGRPIQGILDGKAQMKQTTETVANVASTVGLASSLTGLSTNNLTASWVGLGSSGVGLISGLVASAVTPAADTRAWASLPAGVYMIQGQLPNDNSTPTLKFRYRTGEDGEPVESASLLSARESRCAIAWGRTESAISASAARVASAKLDDKGHKDVNAAFRANLESTFGAAPVQASTAYVPTI